MDNINNFDILKFYQEGKTVQLITTCEKYISFYPDEINNYWCLSAAYLLNNQIDMAQSIWMSVLWESDDIDKTTQELVYFIHKLARELVISNYYQEAKLFYEQLITLDEDNLLNYKCLLDLNLQINNQEEAEIIFKHLINSNYSDHAIYLEYAQFLAKQYRHEELFLILKQGIKKFPFEQNLYLAMVQFLKNNGRAKEAIAFAEQGLKLNPDNIIFQLENAKILPIIYESEEEIEFYRKRFTEHLDNISQNLCLKNEMEKKIALTAISLSTNFYLQYQGKNDLKIQKKYGDLLEKITKANFATTSKYKVNNDKKKKN